MESRWYWLGSSSASKEIRQYGEQMVLAQQLQCQQGDQTIWRVDGTGSAAPVLARRIDYMESRRYRPGGLTLVMMGGKQTLVMMGGGGVKGAPPLFLFVKTIEKVIRLCTMLKKKMKLIGSFEDKANFHVILQIDRQIDSIDIFVKNAHNMSLSTQPPLKLTNNSVSPIQTSAVNIELPAWYVVLLHYPGGKQTVQYQATQNLTISYSK